MKKEVVKFVEVCDVCERCERRHHCAECNKVVCHNCVRDFTKFQRRVKSSSINTIDFCSECVKKDIPLVKQLQQIKQLRAEWWPLVEKYEKLADDAEFGISGEWE